MPQNVCGNRLCHPPAHDRQPWGGRVVTGPTTGRAVVTTCPDCDGLTSTLGACDCVEYEDRVLVTEEQAPRQPYRDCRVCLGVGRVAYACQRCGQHGRRRGHLVMTVANVDTGAVASVSVEPGTVPPRLAPDGGRYLPLRPLVDGLAGTWPPPPTWPVRSTYSDWRRTDHGSDVPGARSVPDLSAQGRDLARSERLEG